MLDFTSPKTPPKSQMRCLRRAKAARNCARLLMMALGGLVGTALALEPRMATAVRASIAELPGDVRHVAGQLPGLVDPVRIGEGELRPDDNVARADTSLLRP